jgi:hypothetical protein
MCTQIPLELICLVRIKIKYIARVEKSSLSDRLFRYVDHGISHGNL